jgi:Zn-dependent protease
MNVDALLILFQIIILILAFSVHESAHAYAAYRLGDPTAYMLGRVTLNPIKHIDPIGTVILPLLAAFYGFGMLGWAKPCPVTLRNFRKVKKYDIITTLAGPASNLAMAIVAMLLLIVLKHTPGVGENAVLAAMDFVTPAFRGEIDTTQLPPLFPLALFLYYGVLTNVLLFVFNLIPIPPLDGSRILRYYLPYKVEQIYEQIGGYGILIAFFIGGRYILPIFYNPLMNAFDTVLVHL